MQQRGFSKENVSVFDYRSPEKFRDSAIGCIHIGVGNTFQTPERIKKWWKLKVPKDRIYGDFQEEILSERFGAKQPAAENEHLRIIYFNKTAKFCLPSAMIQRPFIRRCKLSLRNLFARRFRWRQASHSGKCGGIVRSGAYAKRRIAKSIASCIVILYLCNEHFMCSDSHVNLSILPKFNRSSWQMSKHMIK